MSHLFVTGKFKATDVKVGTPVFNHLSNRYNTPFLLLTEQRECCCSIRAGADDKSEHITPELCCLSFLGDLEPRGLEAAARVGLYQHRRSFFSRYTVRYN